MPFKLNLGCSDDHRPGFLNVDIAQPADVVTDLNEPWPFEDSSVEYILANDVLEHLKSKIWALNEAHRVLEPGGVLEFMVPCVYLLDEQGNPGAVNPGAFADPTHQTFWTLDDQYYFCEQWNNPKDERGRFGAAYGITALFRPLQWGVFMYGKPAERRSKLLGIWQAVKGGRFVGVQGIPSGEAFGGGR